MDSYSVYTLFLIIHFILANLGPLRVAGACSRSISGCVDIQWTELNVQLWQEVYACISDDLGLRIFYWDHDWQSYAGRMILARFREKVIGKYNIE